MFEKMKILVPLDGSKLAESVLPQVMNLANGGIVEELILVSVIDMPFADLEIKKAQVNRAQRYLENVVSQIRSKGINVKGETIEGEVTKSIIEYSETHSVNIITIATHGYTGAKKVRFGSIAQSILINSHLPVLVIRPESF